MSQHYLLNMRKVLFEKLIYVEIPFTEGTLPTEEQQAADLKSQGLAGEQARPESISMQHLNRSPLAPDGDWD
jgi:hypothetical protein